MQYFKGDDLELKMYESGKVALEDLLTQLDLLFEGAYEASPLGDILYESERAPLSNAISQAIFRGAFNEIFTSFTVAGSFESYLSVFEKIFGEDATITFTVPDPGKLQIDIVAAGIEQSDFITRYISSNQYFFDTIIDDVGDTIVFQSIKGFQSQFELERMLFEMVPAGIFTEITLTLG